MLELLSTISCKIAALLGALITSNAFALVKPIDWKRGTSESESALSAVDILDGRLFSQDLRCIEGDRGQAIVRWRLQAKKVRALATENRTNQLRHLTHHRSTIR